MKDVLVCASYDLTANKYKYYHHKALFNTVFYPIEYKNGVKIPRKD
jgi:hypothetical protein